MKQAKTSERFTYTVKPQLQKIFIVLAIGSLVAQLATILYWLVRQYPNNHNLSAYVLPTVAGVVIPIIFFALAYLIRPKNKSQRARLFDSLFLMTMGLIVNSIVGEAFILLYQNWVTAGSGYWQSVAYSLVGDAVSIILYLVFLYSFRSI